MRPILNRLPPGWNLVLIARPGLVGATLDETRLALFSLLRRAGLFPSNEA